MPKPDHPSPASTPTRKTPRQATSLVAYDHPAPEDDDPLLAFAPYLHEAPRGNSITPELQRRFVAQLAATGVVKIAARSIGRSLEALYRLRHRPGAEGFAAAWDAALERGLQRLEDIALERATLGTATPIVSGGQLLGMWHKPDNGLLRFMLRSRLPEKYSASGSAAALQQSLIPGHPVYDALREELRAEFAAREAKREKERQRRLEEREQEELEWEEEQDRLEAEAEAAKTPEDRQREGLLHMLGRWSLEDLLARVKW